MRKREALALKKDDGIWYYESWEHRRWQITGCPTYDSDNYGIVQSVNAQGYIDLEVCTRVGPKRFKRSGRIKSIHYKLAFNPGRPYDKWLVCEI